MTTTTIRTTQPTATAPTTPLPTRPAFALVDLPQATKDYLRTEVTVEVVRVTEEVGVNEDGIISLRFTNSTEDRGIRLHDVTVHLKVDDPDVLTLSARLATLLEARETGSRSDDRLDPDDLVGEMFVFFPQASLGFELNDVLEPGERLEVEVPYHGEARGTSGVMAHLHGTVSTDDLFPRTNGAAPELSIRIRR